MPIELNSSSASASLFGAPTLSPSASSTAKSPSLINAGDNKVFAADGWSVCAFDKIGIKAKAINKINTPFIFASLRFTTTVYYKISKSSIFGLRVRRKTKEDSRRGVLVFRPAETTFAGNSQFSMTAISESILIWGSALLAPLTEDPCLASKNKYSPSTVVYFIGSEMNREHPFSQAVPPGNSAAPSV